jgi:bifunctional non-homologous end joining protein LigD
MSAKSISLFYTNPEENSDKRFDIILEEAPGGTGWLVNTLNGKRLGTLTSRTLTPDPVDLATAQKLYDQKLNTQLKKGYTPDKSGAAYQSADFQDRATGLSPHLLTTFDRANIEAIFTDPEWMLEEKMNGERLMIQKIAAAEGQNARVIGSNKKGLRVPIPKGIEQAALAIRAESFVIDTEWLGEHAAPFDLVELNGEDLRGLGAEERKERLDALIGADCVAPWIHVRHARTEAEKRALYAEVEAREGEGLVGKKKKGVYKAGRAGKSATQIKIKFFEDATVEVVALNQGKRSVSVGAYDANGQRKIVGSITIPSNRDIPKPGEFIDVTYIYAYPNGTLFHTSYKGPRPDHDKSDCLIETFKFKADAPVPRELAEEIAALESEAKAEAPGAEPVAQAKPAKAPRPRRSA